MISSFYYLAAYTAAVAAGFSQRDSAGIARAARYTEDCAGLTAPAGGGPESPVDQLLALGVFHYLPGDMEKILPGVNPAFFEGPEAASAPMLALVCRPDSRLYTAAIEYARRGMTSGGLSQEAALQRTGIVCHILAAAHLHQGFAGFSSPVVNGVSGVMTAAMPALAQNRRQLLLRARTEPLETLFPMKPMEPAPDPAAGAAGCEQVEALADCPASIFSYQSAWAAAPVSCVNPPALCRSLFRSESRACLSAAPCGGPGAAAPPDGRGGSAGRRRVLQRDHRRRAAEQKVAVVFQVAAPPAALRTSRAGDGRAFFEKFPIPGAPDAGMALAGEPRPLSMRGYPVLRRGSRARSGTGRRGGIRGGRARPGAGAGGGRRGELQNGQARPARAR